MNADYSWNAGIVEWWNARRLDNKRTILLFIFLFFRVPNAFFDCFRLPIVRLLLFYSFEIRNVIRRFKKRRNGETAKRVKVPLFFYSSMKLIKCHCIHYVPMNTAEYALEQEYKLYTRQKNAWNHEKLYKKNFYLGTQWYTWWALRRVNEKKKQTRDTETKTENT